MEALRSPQPTAPAPRQWQSKSEWVVLVENIAQSHARLASGIQLAIEKQWGNNFSVSLQEYAAAKESEIRDVCSENHQEFVDSIEEIVRMKGDVARLQRDIDRFQRELAAATSSVLTTHDSLAACYTVQQYIDESIEKLQQCQRIVGLATTIDQYIQENKLFHALKVLEDLRVEIGSFRGQLFPQRMNDWMHVAMETIKEEAKRSASTWLENIRAASMSIGDHAIRRFENQVSEQYYEQDILEKCGVATPTPSSASTSRSGSNSVSGASNSPAPAPRHSAAATSGGGALPVSPRSAVDEQHQLPKLPSLKVLNSEADALRERSSIHEEYMKAILEHLSPMLRVLHVFRVMNQVPELAAFYNANRLLQSFLRGDIATVTPDKFVGQHEELFRKFAGAFCLEHLLWRYSNEALLTKKEINGIFHLIMQSLCGIITASVLRIEAPVTVLAIKRSAVQCARALGDEVHEYNATAVFDTFRRLGAHFRHSLLTDTTKHLREFMASDTFENVRLVQDNVQEMLTRCGLVGKEAEMLKSVDLSADVVVLPFTDVVARSCASIEALVHMMFDYERYLNMNDWGDAVRDDVIEALGFLNQVLNEAIDQRSDLQVAMAVMLGTNASYLACACDHFEALVKEQTKVWEARTYGYSVTNTLRASAGNSNTSSASGVAPANRFMLSKAGAKKKFESTMTRAQDMVCELMLKKIDELLSSFYFLNWAPAAASTQPDPCMWDLINYLKVTFAQLEQLPTVVKEAVHFASCIHICKSIEQVLSGSVVKKLNAAGIANFKRNLDALLDFVGSIPIQQLREVFLALTQLVELLLSGGADKFLDPQQREAGKYSHLSVETVATVLDKIKEHKPSGSKLWGGGSSSSSSASTAAGASTTTVKKGLFGKTKRK